MILLMQGLVSIAMISFCAWGIFTLIRPMFENRQHWLVRSFYEYDRDLPPEVKTFSDYIDWMGYPEEWKSYDN